jgi:hypothetical protein
MKRRSTKQQGDTEKASKNEVLAMVALDAVWSGSIARLRIYHSDGTIIAYKAPGHNSDAVGDTDDPNIIQALFLARDNGRPLLGYTDAHGRIGWLDY